MGEDQSENYTDVEKDSSVIAPLNEPAGGAASSEAIGVNQIDGNDVVPDVQRTPFDIQERLNRTNDKQLIERTPEQEEDEYSEDDFA